MGEAHSMDLCWMSQWLDCYLEKSEKKILVMRSVYYGEILFFFCELFGCSVFRTKKEKQTPAGSAATSLSLQHKTPRSRSAIFQLQSLSHSLPSQGFCKGLYSQLSKPISFSPPIHYTEQQSQIFLPRQVPGFLSWVPRTHFFLSSFSCFYR